MILLAGIYYPEGYKQARCSEILTPLGRLDLNFRMSRQNRFSMQVPGLFGFSTRHGVLSLPGYR